MEAASAVAETFRAALRFRVTLRTVTRSALVWSGRPVMRHAKHPSLSLRFCFVIPPSHYRQLCFLNVSES